jgi:hypothetical protein
LIRQLRPQPQPPLFVRYAHHGRFFSELADDIALVSQRDMAQKGPRRFGVADGNVSSPLLRRRLNSESVVRSLRKQIDRRKDILLLLSRPSQDKTEIALDHFIADARSRPQFDPAQGPLRGIGH